MAEMKEYPNEDIVVQWEASKCKHAGVCVRMLPKVYNPRARPWINVENASTQDLKKQIDACPSGALSYRINKDK